MDTKKHRSARYFIELARQKAAQGREEVFGNIADLFLDERVRLSDRERSVMTGILRTLIAEVETALRRELSGLVADRDDVPAGLKSSLAGIGTEIARPILMRSQALRSPELVELIRFRGREHRLAIAMRPSLNSNSGDTGPAGSENDVIEALLRHPDPELAQHASDYLVAEAGRIDRLRMPVLRAADLPAGLALRLHWWVSAALRQHLTRHFPVDPSMIDDQIEAATLTVVSRQESDSIAIAALARQLMEKWADIEPPKFPLLIGLVQAGRIAAFLAGLSQFARIPEPAARRIALQGDGESLALLCKAFGVDREGLSTLAALLENAGGGTGQLPSDVRNSILAFYDKITKGNARAALDFWRRDPEFVSAIEEVGAATDAQATEDPPTSE